ncbi:MAG: HlyD family efflux transporter periplasmic adaptor subunit [Microbacteriaceae bacterium]|nr:HlyD family efflux transporter periplasmic adaptor subunit [Microbacteriaceae bacterium]MBT5247456.1 HlyD family efflux transporter periplasmic adaptor subunit [Microbacteriaceae bacterium]MBT5730834.1 HlyD family efflux transporter periplasmic adaptor subunit [Microbacteriaceae bacterium]
MKTRTKVIIGVVAAVAVIGAGAGIAASFAPSTEGTFLTEEVQIRDVDVTVAASGSVSPSKELGLQFPAAATATLETLLVSVGDTVSEGQVLASLNTSSLQAAVVAAEASVASALSAVANAETSGDSARQAISAADQAITAADLAIENVVDQYPSTAYPQPNDHIALLQAQKQKVTAEASLETARRQLEAYVPLKASAQASLRSAQASLDSANVNLANATMTAPFAGTIVAIASELGEPIGTTSVGTQGTSGFIVLAAIDEFVVKADFAESEVVGITEGQSVRLEFDAIPDEVRDGIVTEVALFGSVDLTGSSLTTYEVTISVPNAPQGLRAGMTAQASITTEERLGVVAAPVTALIEQGDGYIVQVEDAEGAIRSLPVDIGIRGGYYVEIISGLEAGDRVVTGSDGTLPATGAGGFGGPPEGVRENND